jgi:phosphopantothenate synthetase
VKSLFWLTAGVGLGVFGYRYYQRNGGRLPILDDLLGGRTDEIAHKARQTAKAAQRNTEQAVSDTVSNVAGQTVTAVAEDVVEAEEAKKREDSRHQP